MSQKKNYHYFEIALYCFISIIVLILPLFIRSDDGIIWSAILKEWLRLLPFFLIFFVNNFLLAPKLLLKGRYPAYIVSSLGLLVLVVLLNVLIVQPYARPDFPDKHKKGRIEKMENFHHPAEIRPHDRPMPGPPKPPFARFFNFGVFIVGLLIIGFNSGIKVFIRWIQDKEEHYEIEKQFLSTELAYLKQQISPHFFMNTLNNIHALIDIDPEKSKDAVIKLSKLMRYLLYEANNEMTPLNRELEFMDSYIELMRLRYKEEDLAIRVTQKGVDRDVYVPSLLFLPLVENAFKYGVKTNVDSFINIDVSVERDELKLLIKNSDFSEKEIQHKETSGIGLENIKKRLDLIYKNNYTLTINPEEDCFEVLLIISVI